MAGPPEQAEAPPQSATERNLPDDVATAKATQSAAASAPDAPPRIPRSPSVQGAVDLLGDSPVHAWDVVRQVLREHGEYGHGLGEKLAHDERPSSTLGPLRLPEAWLAQVEALFDPAKLTATHGTLHGRLLIGGLARVEPGLGEFLADRGFLKALVGELTPPFDAILATPASDAESAPAASPPAMLPDPAPLHVDGPASQDQLGRESFVKALAIRLNRVRVEYGVQEDSDAPPGFMMRLRQLCGFEASSRLDTGPSTTGARAGFMMHLHGPWGSGKSSLLNLLRRELQPNGGKEGRTDERAEKQANGRGGERRDANGSQDRSWVVVDFNAWQNQRLDPPWWPLLDSMYRQARRQIRTVHKQRWRAFRLRALETWRRLVATHRGSLLALVIAGAAATFILFFFRPFAGQAPGSRLTVDTISGILALIGTIASFGLLMSRSLLGGSVDAVREFMQTTSDPTAWMIVHFRRLVDTIDRPVMVFVDDLDRCQRDYVVKLLEGIQTLLRDPRVMYVVAADRRWIHACFEQTYADFAGSVREPGRPLGSLFLDKAFQLSIAVPRLSQQDIARYWGLLVRGESIAGSAGLAAIKAEVREELGDATTQEEILRTAAIEEDDPVRAQVRRQVMVERLAGVEAEKSTEAFLLPFAPFLDGNPRAMKRLVNAYALHRDIALLAGVNLFDLVLRKQLALWTILSLRWPLLDEFYLQKAAGRDPDESNEIADLLRRPSVRAVLDGRIDGAHDVHAALDLEAIARLAGLAEGEAGAVA